LDPIGARRYILSLKFWNNISIELLVNVGCID
jgi:hypothetical protein